MRAIISRIVAVFNGGGGNTTGHRQGLLSQVSSTIRTFFSGGRRRH